MSSSVDMSDGCTIFHCSVVVGINIVQVFTRVSERFPSGFGRLFPSQLLSISFLGLHTPLTRVMRSCSTGLPGSSQQLPGDLLSSLSAMYV